MTDLQKVEVYTILATVPERYAEPVLQTLTSDRTNLARDLRTIEDAFITGASIVGESIIIKYYRNTRI